MKRLATLVLLFSGLGCALTSRGSVLDVRYFSPEPPATHQELPSQTNVVVRLGSVRSAPHLRERIAYRESEYELGFYDDKEWTDRPEFYLRRALERKLFEVRHFEQTKSSSAPSLEVELLAFEEQRLPSFHGACVEVRYQVVRDDVVLDGRTIRVAHAVEGPSFQDFVAALSEALDEVTDGIADGLARTPQTPAAAQD
jgi:cholesterol transport system auxiliary component